LTLLMAWLYVRLTCDDSRVIVTFIGLTKDMLNDLISYNSLKRKKISIDFRCYDMILTLSLK